MLERGAGVVCGGAAQSGEKGVTDFRERFGRVFDAAGTSAVFGALGFQRFGKCARDVGENRSPDGFLRNVHDFGVLSDFHRTVQVIFSDPYAKHFDGAVIEQCSFRYRAFIHDSPRHVMWVRSWESRKVRESAGACDSSVQRR